MTATSVSTASLTGVNQSTKPRPVRPTDRSVPPTPRLAAPTSRRQNDPNRSAAITGSSITESESDSRAAASSSCRSRRRRSVGCFDLG